MNRFSYQELELYDGSLVDLVAKLMSLSNITLATPNIDHYVRLYSNNELVEIYTGFNCIVNDSYVFQLLTKLFHLYSPSTLCGSDLIEYFFSSKCITRKEVTYVGPTQLEVEAVYKKFSIDDDCSYQVLTPPFGFMDSEPGYKQLLDNINERKAEFVLLCLGSPLQEIVARDLRVLGCNANILCVGASIDYLSGKERRAPKVFRSLGLEWLFRLLQSPRKRFYRYFINCPKIIYFLFLEKLNLERKERKK